MDAQAGTALLRIIERLEARVAALEAAEAARQAEAAQGASAPLVRRWWPLLARGAAQ